MLNFQDLQNGAKILSADDASMEVIKVERQKTNKLLELERPDRALGGRFDEMEVMISGSPIGKVIDLVVIN